jgi:hypothetical protein
VSPDWTGSPQHVVAGVALALVTYVVARRRVPSLWSLALALTVTMAAEAVVELLEYPVLYGDSATAQNYYDTIADIGATLAGAVVGALAGLVVRR